MDNEIFENILEDSEDQLGEIKENSNSEDTARLVVNSELEADRFYRLFDSIIKEAEEDVTGSIKPDGNYYLIEIDEKERYVAEIKDNPEYLVYYIPRLAFEVGLSYEESNSCYSLADIIDRRTEVKNDYDMTHISVSIILIYLIMEDRMEKGFGDFEVLNIKIEESKFDEIYDTISSKINQVRI